ncbi:Ig heavy chain V region 441, partial [Balearica regulorum gibbericeps]
LSCRGSGFNFWNYYFLWYCQTPGSSLEWVSTINIDSSEIKFGPTLRGRATASRDNSRSESSLSLRDLHSQDSACYFCAV